MNVAERLYSIDGVSSIPTRKMPPATLTSIEMERLAEPRASSYIIYVDLPDTADDMLLVHGYTGAYDRVSKSVATYVRSLERRRAPKPLYGVWGPELAQDTVTSRPSEETLLQLRKRGYLTTLSFEAEQFAFQRFASMIHDIKSRQPTYIFMPTYQCNLRCSYCFQDHMRTDPAYQHLLRTMSKETVDRIFAGMAQIEAAHGARTDEQIHRTVGFYGGEPFLQKNVPIVEHIIDRTLELGPASFWAVSNATELESYRHLLRPDKISSVQITLDGPPAEHDARRIHADGSGSFLAISRNISMCLDAGVSISIRLNIDRKNISFLPDTLATIQQHGWDKSPLFGVYAAPVRSYNDKVQTTDCLDPLNLDREITALQQKLEIANIIAGPDDAIRQQARKLFRGEGSPIPVLKESFCSAHTGMYIFDCFADIYACWEKTGDGRYRVGHVDACGQLKMDVPMLAEWRERTVASNPVCSKCRYALNCGGGCAVLAQNNSGEMHSNFCDSFANRFRSSVSQAYLDHQAGAAFIERAGAVCDQ